MNRDLNVAMLIWSYWPGHEGGAERQCRKIIPYLERHNLRIVVLTAWTRRSHHRCEMEGCHEVIRLGWAVPFMLAVRRGIERLLGRFMRGSNQQVRAQARKREAILFWLGLPVIFLARVCFLSELWLWFRKVERRPDVIHVQESSWMAGAAAFLARPYGIPVVAKTASYPAWDVLGYDVPLRRLFSRARRDCGFVALTSYLADNLLKQGIPKERIFLVPNGVEIPEHVGQSFSSMDVLFVANFSQGVESKAFDNLLNAWRLVAKNVPSARLILLGDGDRMQWMDMVESMQLQKSVFFKGWVPDPAKYYRCSALFVLPSRSEGISNALLEAQSWGMASVVTAIPGNLVVVQDEENGLVVPVDDYRKLADGIICLLKNPQLRERLGRAGREKIIKKFSLESVACKLLAVYKAVKVF